MIFRIEDDIAFPDPLLAEEDGLLGVGGDLCIDRLLFAYQLGIFPWYAEDTPILWYAPLKRFVINPTDLKVSKSMRQVLRKGQFRFTINQAFEQVITNCANIARPDQDGTWIVDDMRRAYIELHNLGFAHSVEVWENEELVGGLYGVLVGKVFCGESMFSKVSNSSKAALIYLIQNFELELVDCQIYSEHLETLGAKLIDAKAFYSILEKQNYVKHGLQTLFRYTS